MQQRWDEWAIKVLQIIIGGLIYSTVVVGFLLLFVLLFKLLVGVAT